MASDRRRYGQGGPTVQRDAGAIVPRPGAGEVSVDAPKPVPDLIAIDHVGLGRVPVAWRSKPVRQEAELVQALRELALGHCGVSDIRVHPIRSPAHLRCGHGLVSGLCALPNKQVH
ncbi:hypothetical protein [Methylobacterium sp. A54F]